MTQVGDIGTSPNGAAAGFIYRYSGHGRGSGIAVLKIARGKIVPPVELRDDRGKVAGSELSGDPDWRAVGVRRIICSARLGIRRREGSVRDGKDRAQGLRVSG